MKKTAEGGRRARTASGKPGPAPEGSIGADAMGELVAWIQVQPRPGPRFDAADARVPRLLPPCAAELLPPVRRQLAGFLCGKTRRSKAAGFARSYAASEDIAVAVHVAVEQTAALVLDGQAAQAARVVSSLAVALSKNPPLLVSPDAEMLLLFARAWLLADASDAKGRRAALALASSTADAIGRLAGEQGFPVSTARCVETLRATVSALGRPQPAWRKLEALRKPKRPSFGTERWVKALATEVGTLPAAEAEALLMLLGFCREGHRAGLVDFDTGTCQPAAPPSALWIARCRGLVERVGRETFVRRAQGWLGAVQLRSSIDAPTRSPESLLVRGLVWCSALADDQGLTEAVVDLNRRAFAEQWTGRWAIATTTLGALPLTPTHGAHGLAALARRVRHAAVRRTAEKLIAKLAEARGVTPDELADDALPPRGLDSDGTLRLSFGTRVFVAALDDQGVPCVKDESGRVLPGLPRPGKRDDSAEAAKAAEAWKRLRQASRDIVAVTCPRLERAMCARRRWSVDAFRSSLLGHPLLLKLSRHLLWAACTPDGRISDTFRVSEDGSSASLADTCFVVGPGLEVTLPHPVELDAAARAAWSKVFGEYELIQPFPQLQRPVYTVTAAEREAKRLTRFDRLGTTTGAILGLKRLGWQRGPLEDGPSIASMRKPVDGAAIDIDLGFEPGITLGVFEADEEQTVVDVLVGRRRSREGIGRPVDGDVALCDLDPIAFSELVRDLKTLAPMGTRQ